MEMLLATNQMEKNIIFDCRSSMMVKGEMIPGAINLPSGETFNFHICK